MVDGLAVRAYLVNAGADWPEGGNCIVYSDSEEHACEMAEYHLDGDVECFVAEHAPEHDARASLHFASTIEEDPEYLRDAGWRFEGEWNCGGCGLSAFGMEKYGVCRLTSQCKECGCDDADSKEPECDHADGFSCGD